MKYLIHKLCISGGLLVAVTSFSQTVLEDEIQLKQGETSQQNIWVNDFKENQNDHEHTENKAYGNGVYSVTLAASGASAVNKSSEFKYAQGGCIYTPSSSTSFAAYDIQLQIPNGHEIQGMRYSFIDRNASKSRAILYSVSDSGTYTDEHIVFSTGDTGYGSEWVNMPTRLTINNSTHKYGIRFESYENSANQAMCSARLQIGSAP